MGDSQCANSLPEAHFFALLTTFTPANAFEPPGGPWCKWNTCHCPYFTGRETEAQGKDAVSQGTPILSLANAVAIRPMRVTLLFTWRGHWRVGDTRRLWQLSQRGAAENLTTFGTHCCTLL